MKKSELISQLEELKTFSTALQNTDAGSVYTLVKDFETESKLCILQYAYNNDITESSTDDLGLFVDNLVEYIKSHDSFGQVKKRVVDKSYFILKFATIEYCSVINNINPVDMNYILKFFPNDLEKGTVYDFISRYVENRQNKDLSNAVDMLSTNSIYSDKLIEIYNTYNRQLT